MTIIVTLLQNSDRPSTRSWYTVVAPHRLLVMGIPAFLREPARLARLTEKSRLFWLPNGSLKNTRFNYEYDYDRCENYLN